MKENVLKTKSYDFALRVVRLCRHLMEINREYVLSKQLLRSGTSIGANIAESTRAESRADFVHKLSVSLKEAFETEYWLRLIADSEFIAPNRVSALLSDCEEIQKILTVSIKTAKSRK